MKGGDKLMDFRTTLEIAMECIHCQAYLNSLKCKPIGDDCSMWLHGSCKDILRKGEVRTKTDFH